MATLVAIAASGAVLMIVASPSGPSRVAAPAFGFLWISRSGTAPPPPSARVVVAVPAPAPPALLGVDTSGSADDKRTVGLVLLTVGLAGIVPVTLFWLWARQGRWPRRTQIDGRPSGS